LPAGGAIDACFALKGDPGCCMAMYEFIAFPLVGCVIPEAFFGLPELKSLAMLSSFSARAGYFVSNPVPLFVATFPAPFEPGVSGAVPALLAAADVLSPNALNLVEMVEFLFGLPGSPTLSLI